MKDIKIEKYTFDFLRDIEKNNNRDWFAKHRDRYERAHENMIDFAEALVNEMEQYDHLVPMTGKKSLYRIYRDVRFSKIKTPYKDYWGGRLKRETKLLRGGYTYRIKPSGSYVAGGFFNPNSSDLKCIRKEIAFDPKPLRKIIANKTFQSYFGSLTGNTVKTAPQGYAKTDPAIDLLRHKQFILKRTFTNKEVLSPDFLKEVVKTFQAFRPFFNYMSEILTTDANGEIRTDL